MGTLQPYIKSRQLFQCPSETTKGATPAVEDGSLLADTNDYFYNWNIGMQSHAGDLVVARKASDIESVANVVLVGDGKSWYDLQYASCAPLTIAVCTPINGAAAVLPGAASDAVDYTAANIGVPKKHLDGVNYAFVDGHVKWLTPGKLSNDVPSGSNFTFRPKT